MDQHDDVRAVGQRVERLLGDLRAAGEPGITAIAEELVGALVQLYGTGLRRLVDIVAEDEAGPRLLPALTDDPLLEGLLLVHDLHPLDTDTRVQRALDRVRPYLGSHAGGVEYLGVDADGVVHLRLSGNCNGCASSTETVRLAIAEAVAESAPETTGVDVEGVAKPQPLLQIGRRGAPAPRAAPAAALATPPAAIRPAAIRPAAIVSLDGQHRVERCELCDEVLDDRHGHVVQVEKRSLVCTCRGCYLLFTRPGAAGGRYRAIPDRYRTDPAHPIDEADWDALQVPVATAFFFENSQLGRIVGSYPSPAGATECELDLAAWARLAATHPLLRVLEPDVEAVLVTRADPVTRADRGTDRGADRGADRGIETFLMPVDACYALVGRIRLLWSGMDGGAEVRAALADFVADLRTRSRPLSPADEEAFR